MQDRLDYRSGNYYTLNRGYRGYAAVATFRGRHNISKARVLIILWSSQSWSCQWYKASELSLLSGVCYAGCFAGLARWYRWRYVLRSRDRPYRYRIAKRGAHFVEARIPPSVFDELKPKLLRHVREYRELTLRSNK